MAKNTQGFGDSPVAIGESDLTYDNLPDDVVPVNDLKVDEIEFQDLGNILPHGIFIEGERLNEYTLHPYKTKYDRILSNIMKASKRKFSAMLGEFLPNMVASIGGYELRDVANKLGCDSSSRIFQNMVFGDAMSLLYRIRVSSQGNHHVAISTQCPNCGTINTDDPRKGRPYHDMGTVPVGVIANLKNPLEVAVRLPTGLTIFGQKCDVIYMKPLKLRQMDKISDSDNVEDISTLYETVSSIPQSEAYKNVRGQVFSDELYDELDMRDLQVLRDAVVSLQKVGPKLTIENECYSCGYEWEVPLGLGRLREFLFVPVESGSR